MDKELYLNSNLPLVVEALKNNTLLTIVGCTKLKVWEMKKKPENLKPIMAAEQVYKGPLFKQFLNFKNICESKNYDLKWKIFSAKYGLILPTDEIEDYNVSFVGKFNPQMNNFIRELETYAMVHKTLINEDDYKNTTVILIWAGKEYVERLQNSISKIISEYLQFHNLKIIAPACGLKIGVSLNMMKTFNEMISKMI